MSCAAKPDEPDRSLPILNNTSVTSTDLECLCLFLQLRNSVKRPQDYIKEMPPVPALRLEVLST